MQRIVASDAQLHRQPGHIRRGKSTKGLQRVLTVPH